MKSGEITVKLMDTVSVCLMVEGKEVTRYKNINLPDIVDTETVLLDKLIKQGLLVIDALGRALALILL